MKRWVIVLAALGLIAGLQTAYGRGARVDNKAIVRRLFEGVNGGNPGVFDELLSADYVSHGPRPGQTAGREETKQVVAAILGAFPDSHVALEDLVAEGDRVALRVTFTGTQKGELKSMTMGILPPSGKHVLVTGMYLYRLAGGKIVEEWSNIDNLGLLVQLGLFQTSLVPLPAPHQK
jgi:predicted ester cyclase